MNATLPKKFDIHENTIVHCFSGGYYLYLMNISNNVLPNKLIIDSAPIEPNPISVSKFLNHFIGKVNFSNTYLYTSIYLFWYYQSYFYKNKINNNHTFITSVYDEESIIPKKETYQTNRILTELKLRILSQDYHPKLTLCLISEIDELLDMNYIKQWKTKVNVDVEKFTFGKHTKLIKIPSYENILKSYLDK